MNKNDICIFILLIHKWMHTAPVLTDYICQRSLYISHLHLSNMQVLYSYVLGSWLCICLCLCLQWSQLDHINNKGLCCNRVGLWGTVFVGLTVDAYEQLRWVKVKVRASSFAIQINSRGQLKSVGNCIQFLASFAKSHTLVMIFKASWAFKRYFFNCICQSLIQAKTALGQTTYT